MTNPPAGPMTDDLIKEILLQAEEWNKITLSEVLRELIAQARKEGFATAIEMAAKKFDHMSNNTSSIIRALHPPSEGQR